MVPSLSSFHPLIQEWFQTQVGTPTPAQCQAWPLLLARRDVLVSAPTGSGKTLAAFLATMDALFKEALAGTLAERTRVVYLSPLRALSNDVQKNLLRPLAELEALAKERGLSFDPIRVGLRTGDTTRSERAAMLRHPPHILVTTPESLYLCLTAQKSREQLKDVETVIVDEIHALARDKRGSHMALSLERLKALCPRAPTLVGLSATQKPLDALTRFLTGASATEREPCAIVAVGHQRPWELRIETPEEDVSFVPSENAWDLLYTRIEELAKEHRTILIFVNTRKRAERVAHDLGERMGHELVNAHHGSMSRELRLDAEERLKSGQLRVMVATASLELGIDIGSVDLVCQIGSPRAIATFLQRVGRSGHQVGGISRGVLFALSLDELAEGAALLHAISLGELDRVIVPEKPLDILAQQLVAMCASDEWQEDALFECVKRSWPFRDLEQKQFHAVLQMLADGPAPERGKSRAFVHWDRVNRVVRGRRGARISALTNGGAIPETFSYPVVAVPDERNVGSVDEEFAIETGAGEVFLLGSTSWRFLRVMNGKVYVEDAGGAPPNAPNWAGESPSRTQELSFAVGRLREELVAREGAEGWLRGELGLSERAAELLSRYVRSSAAILGGVPCAHTVVAERFFDEAGGMQLVIHAPFGARLNRAWGLALRKRFCRNFDFELQAVATDDGVLLSLSEQHSFPLAEIFSFLSSKTVEQVLVQAILQAPMFGTRFRWNATRSLSLERSAQGRRVPPQIQRSRSEDLLAAVFPAQVGCQDNHGGQDIEPPDHPLVTSTLHDCLNEAMDIHGLRTLLRGLEEGTLRALAVDTPEPSPLAHGMLTAHPGAYLDDAPAEERRTRAVQLRRGLPEADAQAFGALDAAAIETVVRDATTPVRDADELYEVLRQAVLVPWESVDESFWETLREQGRAGLAELAVGEQRARFAVARERVRWVELLHPEVRWEIPLEPLPNEEPTSRDAVLLQLVRVRMESGGPLTAREMADPHLLSESDVTHVLHALESVGQVLRGHFRPTSGGSGEIEWCDRRLLRRIHALTVGRLRREIEPLSAQDFMRFLFRWHHVDGKEGLRERAGLLRALSLLEGYEAPAAAWEEALLPSRMHRYEPELLERIFWDGEGVFGRLSSASQAQSVGRASLITFVRRKELDWMLACARAQSELSGLAAELHAVLSRRGAVFFSELVAATKRLPSEVEDALWELVGKGEVTADALENLRSLLTPERRRPGLAPRRGGPGRWSLLRAMEEVAPEERDRNLAQLFLRRYGVVWRDLLVREPLAPKWRELASVYRRMEARGEIRGGRFVDGFAGEQFALPEAVELARAVRRTPKTGATVHLAAVDPLNLTGIVTMGQRIAATPGATVTYVDGIPKLDAAEESPAKLARRRPLEFPAQGLSMKKMTTPVTDT